MAWRDHSLYALPVLCALAACVTNHEALERRPDAGAGGMAGLGRAGAPAQLGGNGGDGTAGNGHPDDEPPGTNLLTVVNGVVDAPELLFCWGAVDANGEVAPFGEPLGDGPLAYAHSLVFRDVTDETEGALQPFVIAGELELVAGLDCQAALDAALAEENPGSTGLGEGGAGGAGGAGSEAGAGGSAGEREVDPPPAVRSRLRARALPAIPAGTLTAGRSLVLVANGCLGGATYTGPSAEEYCGAGYTESSPTVSATLVSLSRSVGFGQAGMQVVHASLANPTIDVASFEAFPSMAPGIAIANRVVEGQVAPRPALLVYPAVAFGANKLHFLQVSNGGSAAFTQGWGAVLANGDIAELSDSTTYALVFSGPRTDSKAVAELWNAPALTLLAADPSVPAAQ